MKVLLIMLYVGLLLVIGWCSLGKNKTAQDFFLGSRAIGPWVSAFAYGTTYFSAVLFIGYAGKIGWGFGLSSLWIVLGNAIVGCFLAWKVLGKRTREMTQRLNTLTMPEFLGVRYDSKAMKIVTALIIFVFLVPYSASVYIGLSYLFEQIFHIPYAIAMVIMAAITAAYLMMGGYRAVALTDFVQGTIMIFGVLMMLFFVIGSSQVGGIINGISRLSEIDPKLVAPVGAPGLIPLVSLVILTSLGSWGLPQMTQKFYTIKDEKVIPVATFVSTGFALLMAFGAYFVGSFSRIFFPQTPPLMNGVPNPDLIMPQIIQMTMPELGATLILLLVLSASMSTLASLVLVSSSAIAIDLVQGGILPEIKKERVVLLMRILCAVFVGFSVYLALRPNVILTLMAFSWGTLAGAFLAPYLYGLYWPGATRSGAWAGIITGVTVSIVGSLLFPQWIPTVGSVSMLLPLAVVPLISIFSPKFEAEHLIRVFGPHLSLEQKTKIKLRQKEVLVDDLG